MRATDREMHLRLEDILSSDIDYEMMKDEIINSPEFTNKIDYYGSDNKITIITSRDKLTAFIKEHKDNLEESYYQRHEEQKRLHEEQMKAQEAAEAEEAAHNKELSTLLITSGYNFEGYRITKYSGYISGDDVTQMPRGGIFGTNNGQNLTDALVRIRRQALKELKEAAFALGCNAVIAVDFDYLTLEPETASVTGGTLYEPYIICVTANGTAVCIEKE